MKHRGISITAAVLLSGCVTAKSVECIEHGGPAWHRANSPHFTVASNLPPEELVAQTETLERLLAGITWAMDYDGYVGDIEAYVLGQGHLKKFEYDVVGVALGSVFVSESNGYRDLSGLLPNTATHELAHVVAGRAFPSIPRWLNEGLATYLETAKLLDPKRMKIGAGIYGYQLHLLNGYTASVEELWAWGKGEEPEEDTQTRLYATSWAFVHYLSNHERLRLKAWLSKLRDGEDPKKEFDRIFPRFATDEGVKAIEHMNGGRFVSATIAIDGTPKAKVSEMSPAAVHLARNELWSLAFRLTPERREAEQQKELQLAKSLPYDDSPETLKELLDRAFITERQFNGRAKGRVEVLRQAASYVERGTPESENLIRAASATAPRDPVLGALRALILTGGDNEDAIDDEVERELASLEPLTDADARVKAAITEVAMLKCEKAAKYLEGLRERGAPALRKQLARICEAAPITACGSANEAGKAIAPALRWFQGYLGSPSGHQVRLDLKDPSKVDVQPPNAVLAGFTRRWLKAKGIGSACVPEGAGDLMLDLRK